MPITHHQTKVMCSLLGEVHLCFVASGAHDNPEFRITDAWVQVREDKTAVTLGETLTRINYSRPRIVDLPEALYPAIRLAAWDDMLDQMQKDRDPMMAGYAEAAE